MAEIKEEIVLRIKPNGTVECDWWTPAVGNIVCALCGRCPGWSSDEKKDIKCTAGNRWCG